MEQELSGKNKQQQEDDHEDPLIIKVKHTVIGLEHKAQLVTVTVQGGRGACNTLFPWC